MVDDIGGHEIGIVARDALAAEGDHRLRHVDIDDDAAAEPARTHRGDSLEIVFGRQAGEGAIDQFAGGHGIDVADDRNGQLVAREHAPHIVAQVGDGHARHRLQRALALTAVRMTGKRGLPPAAAGEVVRIGGIAAQPRQFLSAHHLHRLGVEARRRQCQPQQIEGLVAVLVERAQRAAELVAPDSEMELDSVVFQALMEGLAVEIAGALVEQVGGEVGGARFVGLVLAGAAVEGVVERDQRDGPFAHQPGHDAGRADDLLDRHRRGARRECQQRKGGEGERSRYPRHERFSAAGLVSLIR